VPPPERWLGYDACKIDFAYQSGSDLVELRTFDGGGNATREVWQWTGQTDVDHQVDYTFADDRPTEAHFSHLGTDYQVDRYGYDDVGQWIHFESDGYMNAPLDGTVDFAVDYTYDDAGNLIREDDDTNGDGVHDPDSYDTYVYGADGCIATEDWHYQGAHDVKTYTNRPNCDPLRVDHDNPVDGVIDDSELFEYGAGGRLVTYDGLGRDVWSYHYDAQGRLIAIDYDYGGDLVIDVSALLSYDCPAGA